MASEETLIQVRREKHQQLNGGTYPLASDRQTWSVASFLIDIDGMINDSKIKTTVVLDEAKGNGTRVLRGRLSALRKSGALTFLNLTDVTGHVQLVATRNNLSDYESLKLLDLGDIVEVTGEPALTKTGERSLLLSEWKVLTKTHRPPPEKFAGIADTELKYRKRYLDLMSSEESRARFLVRSAVLHSVRRFMDFEGFDEVETSTLSSIASGANAKPFITHHNALDTDLRLRVAPELNLKRLLVGGFDRVFEIGRAYRNEGIDTRHNPEFTIMESYEAYGKFPRLIQFTQDLLRVVDDTTLARLSGPTRDFYKKWQAERAFTFNEFRVVTMWDAVRAACDKAHIHLETSGDNHKFHDIRIGGHWTSGEQPNARLQQIQVSHLWNALDQCATLGQEIAAIFEYVAEPFLMEDYRTADSKYSVPVFITEYPREVCPLARPSDTNPDVCDRFELFVDGRELANAFQELNNPVQQAARFQEQLEHNHKDPMDFDADYVEALEHGMPPAIGFGMGIDRLVMLLTNTTSIKDVILFPTLRPEK